MRYVLKHWQRLTLFLRQPGAPLDNNIVERLEERHSAPQELAVLQHRERSARR